MYYKYVSYTDTQTPGCKHMHTHAHTCTHMHTHAHTYIQGERSEL